MACRSQLVYLFIAPMVLGNLVTLYECVTLKALEGCIDLAEVERRPDIAESFLKRLFQLVSMSGGLCE